MRNATPSVERPIVPRAAGWSSGLTQKITGARLGQAEQVEKVHVWQEYRQPFGERRAEGFAARQYGPELGRVDVRISGQRPQLSRNCRQHRGSAGGKRRGGEFRHKQKT